MEEKIVFEGSENDKNQKIRKTARNKKGMIGILKSKVFIAACVLVMIILVCLLIFPIYRIEDSSMYPTLREGDIVVALPIETKQGDIVAIRYNRMILIRRIISTGGQRFDMNPVGRIYIDTVEYEEPYISEFSRGVMDIDLPYEIPEERLFVMGDNRENCLDSRSSLLGTVSKDMIDGVLFLRIWPLSRITFILHS